MKHFLLLCLLLLCFSPGFGFHMIGGEFSYRCLGDGTFEITLKIYQDCTAETEQFGNNIDDPAYINIFRNSDNQRIIDGGELTLVSIERVPANFENDCITDIPETCLQLLLFRTTVTLPPDSSGYTIAYARCCRTTSILNIVAPGNVSAIYQAQIPGFDSSASCPNNSAVFNNVPPQITCVNNALVYDFSATDIDGDSLSYSLCEAIHLPSLTSGSGNPKPVTFSPPPYAEVSYLFPYSAEAPLPALPALAVDPLTGEMTGTPVGTGRYIVTVCVDEWKDGVLINSHSLEALFLVTDCSKATVASTPLFSDEPNTYIINCDNNEVTFRNNSTGAITYLWDFGTGDATSTEFEPTYTYPDTGIYTVKLVINQGTTCPDSISRLVKIYPGFDVDFDWAGSLCPEDTIAFTGIVTNAFGEVNEYYWDFGDGGKSDQPNPLYSFSKGGIQSVFFAAGSTVGCRDTMVKTILLSDIDPNAGNDTIIVKGYPYRLEGSGGDNYLWTPDAFLSNVAIANPDVTFPDAGYYTYILQVGTEEGCIGYDTVNIRVVNDDMFFLPTGFSPNGDGLNDVFFPTIIGFTKLEYIRVYNRWGKMIFVAYNTFDGWDGTYNNQKAEMGVYFWEAGARDPWGKLVQKKGDVTLVR